MAKPVNNLRKIECLTSTPYRFLYTQGSTHKERLCRSTLCILGIPLCDRQFFPIWIEATLLQYLMIILLGFGVLEETGYTKGEKEGNLRYLVVVGR